MGSEGPAALGLPAVAPSTCGSLFSFRSLQWLLPRLGISDFHLPDEEFGLLKLEKLESSPVNDLENFVPSVSGDGAASVHTQDAQMNPEEKSLRSDSILPFKNGLPRLPHFERPASKKELSTRELLFTPVGTVLAAASTQPDSQISSAFPVVGATPAVVPSGRSEIFPLSPSVPPLQASPRSSQHLGDGEGKGSAVPLCSHGAGAGSARKEEEQATTFPLEAERGPDNKSDEAVAMEKHQQPESKRQRPCRASPEQVTSWPRVLNQRFCGQIPFPESCLTLEERPLCCYLCMLLAGSVNVWFLSVAPGLLTSRANSLKSHLLKSEMCVSMLIAGCLSELCI